VPFGVVSGVGHAMGVLDGRWLSSKGKEGALLKVNVGRPIVTSGDIVA